MQGKEVGWKEWKFKALSDIWTGDADQKAERLIPTGLLGSIRWWFEVLVRGLEGFACDPTRSDLRCPDKDDKRCVVCELFGCAGWARKFRLQVLDENGQVKQGQIRNGETFILRFIPLRAIRDEEWALLDLTLRLIAGCGAIGGKTVLKPSEEPGLADLDMSDFEEKDGRVQVRNSRQRLPLQAGDIVLSVGDSQITSDENLRQLATGKLHGEHVEVKIERGGYTDNIQAWFGKSHHKDYGLIELLKGPSTTPSLTLDQLQNYVKRWRQIDHDNFAWASLKNFWCVKGRYLARQDVKTSTFNRVIGRPEPKNQSNQNDSWLAGYRPIRSRIRSRNREPESKKVFSFKEPESARRTFGFVKPGTVDFKEIKGRLKAVWSNFKEEEFLTWPEIFKQLLRDTEGSV